MNCDSLRTNFTDFFHPPHPFANTCNQKQGTSQSPNQETRNAQQENMMIVMIINGMKDDKKLKIKCKILWRQAQVGITWAQADCNFQNLAGKKTYVWSPGGPRMKLTATMHPCVVWLSFFFLTNRGKMVLRTLALAGSWCPDFQTNIFQNSIFLSNHLSK